VDAIVAEVLTRKAGGKRLSWYWVKKHVRELRKNKVPVRKVVFINSAKLDWYIIKP
jgi:hypothetical protein